MARVAEVQARTQATPDSPLFSLALNHFRVHRIPFGAAQVRTVVRKMAESSPSRFMLRGALDVRTRALAVTSNSRVEASVTQELQRLAHDSREGSCLLQEIMSVVWERLRDSRGMQWKHGLYGLQLLRELILHGPISAITEASDGLNEIRRMKFYENMR